MPPRANPWQKPRQHSIWLHGWHGQRNFGDDVFAVVTAWAARKYWDVDNVYISTDANGQLATHGVSSTFRSHIPFIGRWNFRRRRHESSSLIFAGGNLFPSEDAVLRLLADTHWCTARKKEIAIGISVGPFESQAHEEATLRLLNRFQFVGFRDAESQAWAGARSLTTPNELCFDLAPLLPLAIAGSTESTPLANDIGLSLMSHHTGGQLMTHDDRRLDFLAEQLSRQLSRNGQELKLLALCTHPKFDDTPVCEQFAARCSIPTKIYRHEGNPVETYRQIQSCSHIISMRLHGSVMAFTAGVPCMQLSYHPKCRQFADLVGFSPECCIDLERLQTGSFHDRLKGFLRSDTQHTNVTVEEAQAKSLKNFQTAAIVINPK